MLDVLINALISGVLLFLVFLYFKAKIDKAMEPSRLLEEVRGEINELIRELNQTTDRNIELIEERINTMAELLNNADKRLTLLKKEQDKGDKTHTVYTNLRKKAPIRMQNDLFDIQEEKTPSTPRQTEPVKTTAVTDPKREVIKLFGQGLSSQIIANKLGLPVGEVELIISLKGKAR